MTPAPAALAVLLAAAAPPLPLTPLEAAALERVREALPQRTVPALSPPLVEAARALAAGAARGDPAPISPSRVRAALGEAGASDPAPAAVVLSARPATLPEALAAAARFRGATHLGVGVAPAGEVSWAVLLASDRRAELDPFPRRLDPGARPVLSGRLLGLASPRVWVSTPGGAAFEVPVEGDDRGFSARVPVDAPGLHRVEVGGSGPRGPTVAALLEAWCGPGARPAPAPAPPGPRDPVEGEARIREAVDALRARQGLPPLRRAPALDDLARRHAADMLAASTVAHVLAPGGGLAARLGAAGIPYRTARENVARGDGALDAHRATVESPAHLATLLAPGDPLLGLGVASGTLPGGQPVVYLTEILVEPRGALPAAAGATGPGSPVEGVPGPAETRDDAGPAGAGPEGPRRPRRGGAGSRSSRCSTRPAAGSRRACSACRSSCSRRA